MSRTTATATGQDFIVERFAQRQFAQHQLHSSPVFWKLAARRMNFMQRQRQAAFLLIGGLARQIAVYQLLYVLVFHLLRIFLSSENTFFRAPETMTLTDAF